MDVSIIIINYNTLKLTEACIQSIFNKTKKLEFEIILVDNASTDGSREFFQKFPNIKYIYSETNLGFGKANNLGAEYSTGRYLFFLNSDTILINNAIKILSDCLDTDNNIGIIGGNLYKEEGIPTISYERYYPSILQLLNRYFLNIPFRIIYGKNQIHNFSQDILKVAYVSGADLMIRKNLFNEVKGFSPQFFMYFEETDLCYRVKKQGYLICSCPQAQIIHLEGGSMSVISKDFNYRKSELMYTSRKIFIQNHHNKLYFLADYYLQRLFLYALYFIRSNKKHYKRLLNLQK